MADTNEPAGIDASGLRERLSNKPDAPQKALSVDTAQQAVQALNRQEEKENKAEKDKKTYGRTPDGTGEYFQCSPRRDVSGAFVVALQYLRQVVYSIINQRLETLLNQLTSSSSADPCRV